MVQHTYHPGSFVAARGDTFKARSARSRLVIYGYLGGSIAMGVPRMDGLYWKIPKWMIWGYPHIRKPLCELSITIPSLCLLDIAGRFVVALKYIEVMLGLQP